MWICTGNKLAKFHGNTLSLSENIAKSFRGGGYFFDSHCIRVFMDHGIGLVINTNLCRLVTEIFLSSYIPHSGMYSLRVA